MLTDKVIGYHYTNPRAYRSMEDGNIYDKKDLIGIRRFVGLGATNFPDEAYDGVIEGVLEPEPSSWLDNPEFPGLWKWLMHDICREDKVMLLSFELNPSDSAYIVERAHVERELYRYSQGKGPSTKKTKNIAFKKYWESRIPVFDYDGGFSVPQLTIWSPIEFSRLNVEWVKGHDEVWEWVKGDF